MKGPEDDPNDDSVGLGGIPNEEGVVELDACCMHGPTRRAGSVGGVRNIKNVSLVSKAVMDHTGHVMLVGEGAERFAVAVGFPRENPVSYTHLDVYKRQALKILGSPGIPKTVDPQKIDLQFQFCHLPAGVQFS